MVLYPRRTGAADFGGHVRQILAVALRHDHRANARACRSEDFFFDAANGEHFAAQRDLAGHRHVGPHDAVVH